MPEALSNVTHQIRLQFHLANNSKNLLKLIKVSLKAKHKNKIWLASIPFL